MDLLVVGGYLIIAAALAQAGVGLAGALRRRAQQARQERDAACQFERRAAALLREAEARRDKAELSWAGLRKFTIVRRTVEADGICSLYLSPHDQRPLPPFEPGQYLTFQLRVPGHPRPVVRCYSLSDSPSKRDCYRVTVKRLLPPDGVPGVAPGLSSSYIHDWLRVGDILDVRAPAGHFCLSQSADRPVVLIAGGIGLTPLLSMLNAICESGSGREAWLFYGVRHGGEHLMKEHLAGLQRMHSNVRVITCYSRPRAQDREGQDYDFGGRVSADLLQRLLPSPNCEFYVCGPPPMTAAIIEGLEAWGVLDTHIHYEAFGPATVRRTVNPRQIQDAAVGGVAQSLEVVFARSGKTVAWRPGDGTILDLAQACGIAVEFGCRAGSCGTCLTAIKEGEVSYLSEPGALPETGSCLSCIAAPKGRLVLDA